MQMSGLFGTSTNVNTAERISIQPQTQSRSRISSFGNMIKCAIGNKTTSNEKHKPEEQKINQDEQSKERSSNSRVVQTDARSFKSNTGSQVS